MTKFSRDAPLQSCFGERAPLRSFASRLYSTRPGMIPLAVGREWPTRPAWGSACRPSCLGPPGARRTPRAGRGPRLHDLRNTVEVQSLENWERTGKDPAREMIKLTTYLGHSDPAHTYWYLEAVPELLARASQRVEGEVRP